MEGYFNSEFYLLSHHISNQYYNEKNQNNRRLGYTYIFSIGNNFNISYQDIVPLDRYSNT
jgi:hypothetical protein